jgi:hypothetical protein
MRNKIDELCAERDRRSRSYLPQMFKVGMAPHQWSAGTRSHTAPSAMFPRRWTAKDGIEGVLILSDDDENSEEIAALFTGATGRPVWRT